jgi:glutamyl-Q tRNA(Asp) synthetase
MVTRTELVTTSIYTGRYAPSPTGPLHFGSLVAAVASYLDARSQHGHWLLRMEDLDKPREMPGATDDILKTLEKYGFEWDGDVLYQSQRHDAYQATLDQLIADNKVYPCNCSRREVADIAHAGIEGPVYPGFCREGLSRQRATRAWRFKTDVAHLIFKDQIQGMFDHRMQQDIGDFVLKRADGQFAYQLAVVVDDAEQGINHVVRGADLLNSTSRQILLQYALSLPSPSYAHIPVASNQAGEKLSKQTHAQPLRSEAVIPTLIQAFSFLAMATPAELHNASLAELWHWAVHHWQPEHIPTQTQIIFDSASWPVSATRLRR